MFTLGGRVKPALEGSRNSVKRSVVKPMDYRNLGKSGVKVSPLCLGTMMFGGATDEATTGRIVAKAREQGVNFIDSADAYNGGKAEEIASMVVYLASDAASFVTGAVMTVNGGQYIANG